MQEGRRLAFCLQPGEPPQAPAACAGPCRARTAPAPCRPIIPTADALPLPPCILLQIAEEQRLRAELEHQVEAVSQRIAQQRVQMGAVNNSAEQAIKVCAGCWVLRRLAAAQHS